MDTQFDIAIIGGGLVGLATALAALQSRALRLVVLEAEPRLGSHQTGHNSGVIHSGVYYQPGSLKARLCAAGRIALEEYCDRRSIPFLRCGKLILATNPFEVGRLDEIERRGRANGLQGLRRLPTEAIAEFEPHAAGVAALHVPQTGIVDFSAVARSMAEEICAAGGEIRTNSPAIGAAQRRDRLEIRAPNGPVAARLIVNCAGLHCDRVARMLGVRPSVHIIPFRGDFVEVRGESAAMIRNLIYPVPDPRFPFLGMHFTRTIDGRIEAGPNAMPVLSRHGYRGRLFDVRDAIGILGAARFWRLCWRYRRTGLEEIHRSIRSRALTERLQRLVPGVQAKDLRTGRSGVRAQAVSQDGSLVDDFVIEQRESAIHVLNAPSPAATASIAIGRFITDMAIRRLRG